MPDRLRLRPLLALVLAVCCAVPLQAATPREQLLRYVPEKVGFCLVLNDLRGQSAALLDSPFVEQFLQSKLGKELAGSTEIAKIAGLDKFLKETLDTDWRQLRDEIFGDAVVLAYRPGPPGQPESEQGLILLHARDADLLAKLLDTINTKQKASGDLKTLEELPYRGLTYYRRTEKKETNYYYRNGSLFLFTAQEEFLKQALTQGLAENKDNEPLVTRRFRELRADKALLALWLNPRAFDAALLPNQANSNKTEAELAFAKGLTPYWQALDSVVVSATLDKDLKIQVGLQTRFDDLPSSARTFLQEAAKPSAVWQALPADALLAVGGRLDLAALFGALGEFLPEKTRQTARDDLNRTVAAALGKEDFFKDVLPQFGPDFGFALSALPATEKAWFPRSVLAVRVGNGKPAFAQTVYSALNAYALLAVLGNNKSNPQQPLALKTILQGEREVKVLTGEHTFPPGVQPALALQSGHLMLASSPEVMQRCADAIQANKGEPDNGEVPLLRASFKELRLWLRARQEAVTPFIAEQNKLTPEEAQKRLEALLTGLELVDRLEISQRSARNQVIFTFTLQTAWPLRK